MHYSDSGARADHAGFKEPRQAQTHQDIKDVTSYGITDCHISVALLDYSYARETVRNTDPSRYEGEAHHSVGDTKGEPNHGDHPDHDVATKLDFNFISLRRANKLT